MAIPRSRNFLGIGKETRPAPGVAPSVVSATDYIPFTSMTTKDIPTMLDDKGVRGSMVDLYDSIQGNIYSEIEIGGDVFPDTTGYPIAGVLGDVQFSAGTPNTHTLSTLNSQSTNGQPVTWSIYDYYGLGTSSTRVFAGSQWESIDLKFTADAMFTYTAKAKGYASATAANPTPSFSTVTPLPVWVGVVTLNGSTSTQLAEGNCLIQRAVTPIMTADGNQRPYQLFAGAVKVSGACNLVFESDTELLLFLNNTKPALDIDFIQNTLEVKLHMTKVAMKTGNIDRGKDYLMLPFTYEAISNTTDAGASGGYSPIKVTLKNTKATGTFG